MNHRINLAIDAAAPTGISVYRPLKPAEQKALVQQIQKHNDQEARQKLILHYLGLVVKIAKQYQGLGLELADLIQEGVTGLIRAVGRYNPDRGNLLVYAAWWIRSAVLRALCKHARTVRVPEHKIQLWRRIRQISNELIKTLGKKPEVEAVALFLGLTEKKLIQELEIMDRHTPVDEDLVAGYRPIASGFVLRQSNEVSQLPSKQLSISDLLIIRDELYQCCQDIKNLLDALQALPKRAQGIFLALYGLDDDLQPKTLDYVGIKYGLSRQRIEQIINKIWLTLPEQGFWQDNAWLMSRISYLCELAELINYEERKIVQFLHNKFQ